MQVYKTHKVYIRTHICPYMLYAVHKHIDMETHPNLLQETHIFNPANCLLYIRYMLKPSKTIKTHI